MVTMKCAIKGAYYRKVTKVHMLLNQARAWFLEIDLVHYVSACLCVCVSTPEASNNQWHDVA